jgi:hypothetical protein
MEERRSFVMMNASTHLFSKTLMWFILHSQGHSVGVGHFIGETLLMLPFMALGAWILYPVFVAWDSFFEHDTKNTADFNLMHKV